MAPSGEDAGGNREEKDEEGEGGGERGGLKGGSEVDDGPPGTWLKCSSPPNVLLYFERQQEVMSKT